MKKGSRPWGVPYRILPHGIYVQNDSAAPVSSPKAKRYLYIVGRILALICAVTFIASSFFWSADGVLNIAVIFFVFGLFFLITFTFLGTKLSELKKEKRQE